MVRISYLSKELASGAGERRVDLQALDKGGWGYELHLLFGGVVFRLVSNRCLKNTLDV